MAAERPRERADAARNRRAILDATALLLAEHGAATVTMDRVAAAAGVGKGTIFHRFGSRAGLLHELVGERARALRQQVATGSPPLGPGAPARDRLLAFIDAFVLLLADNAELMALYQALPPHPDRDELHAFWAAHMTALLTAARPDLDAELMSALLIAPLGGEAVAATIRAGQRDRVRAGMRELVAAVLDHHVSE